MTGKIDQKIKIFLDVGEAYEVREEYKKALCVYQKALRFLKVMKSGRLKDLLKTNINARICVAYLVMGDYEIVHKFKCDTLPDLKGTKDKDMINLLAGS